MHGLGTLVTGLGWVALGVIDVISLFGVFAFYGFGWGIVSLVFPPAWLVIPFFVGWGLPYVIALAVTGIGLAISAATE